MRVLYLVLVIMVYQYSQLSIIFLYTGVDVNKKLRVCDVCGSFLTSIPLIPTPLTPTHLISIP
jgi:hypothetical protein